MPVPPPSTCASCAWLSTSDGTLTCQGRAIGDAPGPERLRTDPACELYESQRSVGCDDCGACCREAYDSVPVEPADAERLGPTYQDRIRVHDDGWTDLHRVPTACGTRCIALHNRDNGYFYCDMYDQRPQTCRDVAIGSAGCLFARRRVGLSVNITT